MIFLVSTVPVISPLTGCRLTACLELNIPQSMTWNNRRSTSQCRIFSYHSHHLGNEEKKRHDTFLRQVSNVCLRTFTIIYKCDTDAMAFYATKQFMIRL